MQLRRPDLAQVLELAEDAVSWPITYTGPDPSSSEPPPSGFRRHDHRRHLGVGPEVFARSVAALESWTAHLGSGFEVVASDAPISIGQTVVMVTRIWPLWVVAACRINNTATAPRYHGFTYVTLRGHPECGAESFAITADDLDQVFFEISSISRPAERLVRLAGPLSRALQQRVTKDYLDALATVVARP